MSSRRLHDRLEHTLEYASHIDLYGNLPELHTLIVGHKFDDAIQLIRRVRLHDNQPVVPTPRPSNALRYNEYLLLQLEAKIAELITLVDPQVRRPRRHYSYDITTQVFRTDDGAR
jgi:hypothetical protein